MSVAAAPLPGPWGWSVTARTAPLLVWPWSWPISVVSCPLPNAPRTGFPEKLAARQVVLELEQPRALLEALEGDEVDVGKKNGNLANFKNPLVVPAAEPLKRGLHEVLRLGALK